LYAAKYESYRLESGKAVDVVPGQVLVKFKKGVSASRMSAAHSALGAVKTESLPTGVELVKTQAGQSVQDAVRSYSALPDVEYAEPNYIRKAFKSPNDPSFSYQSGLNKINAGLAWDKTTGSDTVIVAVVDSGVDYNHPDLAYNIWPSTGYDFIANDSDPKDEYGHGTHIAGIIAAVTNNSVGVAGVAGGFYPTHGCKIMAVRVLDNAGNGDDYTVGKGIVYAANNGAKVINMSLGSSAYGRALKEAVDYAAYGIADSTVNFAYGNGCTLVAASGNGGADAIGDPVVAYPAAYDNVIAVGATDSNDRRGTFSNYGPELVLVAPGVQIYSTMPTYTVTQNGSSENLPLSYAYMSGTSMATPMVSGVAALLISKNPSFTPAQVRSTLTSSAAKVSGYSYSNGWNQEVGYGRIDAAAALGFIIPSIPEQMVKTGTSAPNPFSPGNGKSTVIYLPSGLSTTSNIKFIVYNIAGEKVRTVDSAPGFKVEWDGKNDDGDVIADGMYFYSLESGGAKKTGKITVIK
jgi:thermitase